MSHKKVEITEWLCLQQFQKGKLIKSSFQKPTIIKDKT